ncbi:TetR/AcrR family transcriptional regulator [Nonomuraea soli]|uniref:AcrR family transcriptional regulator n=1 Tax=Nonomuraea soli TaxID=1032476 RepID=A0A7W0CJL7_9ACTN|nr:TetR/AcrR family transcriptional regulator [Nonomuraea soli]MBA2892350.1 AcrR family transcriptional regulator [Nonomuraea soli]
MARPSARPKLIEAALTVVEERGITALTLDAVAEEAGVTKRGLIYHFPSKHALLLGIHEELAARMERQLLEATGGEPEGATLVERTRGYVRAALKAPSSVEMRLIMEAVNEPEWIAPWERVYRRWFPEEEQAVEELDDLSLRCLVARMAADGSWGYETTLAAPLTQTARARIVESILSTLGEE